MMVFWHSLHIWWCHDLYSPHDDIITYTHHMMMLTHYMMTCTHHMMTSRHVLTTWWHQDMYSPHDDIMTYTHHMMRWTHHMMTCTHHMITSWYMYSPHDDGDEPHDDLCQTLEELNHDLCLVTHLSNDYSESDTEPNHTCKPITKMKANINNQSQCRNQLLSI